jgi:hypothetical protein
MSANKMDNTAEIDDAGVPLPRMSTVQALPDFRLSVTWAEGSRAGLADTVDLAPVINTYKFYRRLRKDREQFLTAHLVDDGNAIVWGDGTIDMSAELIEDLAEQAMTPQDFARFLERNKLTQEAAAALLGYSRRQIGYYVSTGPIPRVVALACYGYEARNERERLTEALPSIYEHAREEARAMLLQAAQRFAEDLKQMSSDVRRELDATRVAPRKSILELPQEVVDTAQHMRRAPGRVVVPEAHRPPLSPAQAASRAGGGRAGWLSGLLTRAPRTRPKQPARKPPRGTPNESARPERHGMESLDSLAVDIARMIDHDAAAELWDRYKRGERNVFTRKLYTMQGQKAFEEIRKRYRGDGEFKRAVDRYVGEFERLLEEVSREDRGQMLVPTYLTSETGKVYTMLAHAAGRFD